MIKKFTFLIIFSMGLSAAHAQQKLVENTTALVNGPHQVVASSDDSRILYGFSSTFVWIDVATGVEETATLTGTSEFSRVGETIFVRARDSDNKPDLGIVNVDDNFATVLNYYAASPLGLKDNYPVIYTQDGLGNYYGIGKIGETDNPNRDFIKLSSDQTTVTQPFNTRSSGTNSGNNNSDIPAKNRFASQIAEFADDKILVKAFTSSSDLDIEFFVYDAGDDTHTQITDPTNAVFNSSVSLTAEVQYPIPQAFGANEIAFYHKDNGQLSIYTTDGTTATLVAGINTYSLSGNVPADKTILSSFATTSTEILWTDDNTGDDELYYSTGTGSNKVDINGVGSSSPRSIVANGDKALFVADLGSGYELYTYSGSGVYSQLTYGGSGIAVTPFSDFTKPTIQAAGDGWIFVHDSGSGDQVYYTDGTVVVLLDNGDEYIGFNTARQDQSYVSSEYFYFTDPDKDIFRVAIPDNIYTGGAFTQTVVDDQDHFFDDSYTLASGVVTANNLTISSGNTVTIADGATLVLEDLFSTGSIIVESGGSLVINGDTYGTGTVTATRRTTFNESTGQYSVVGSPMTAATTTVLGASAKVYSYNETLAYGTARFEEVVSGSAMTPGIGYFSTNTGDANGDITFTGTPNTDDIDVTLSYSSGDANDGYNLVANPYLGAISLSQLATDNAANIDGNFYIWDDNNPQGTQGTDADYITVNNSGVVSNNSDGAKGTGFDGNIRSGQGFFVKASSASTLTFSPSQMVNGSNGSDYFFRADGGVDFTRFKVAISGVGGYNETLLAFRDHATNAFDIGMDGLKLAGSGVQLFSYMGEERYAIQTLNTSDLQDAQIDLGVLVSEAGSYSFNIAEVENLPDGLEIVLTHVDTNEEYVLSDGQIELSLNASADAQSFTVSLRAAAVLALDNPNSNNLVVYNSGNSLNINFADDTSLIDFDVFTISGQRVLSARNEQVYANTWKGNVTLSQGHIYIIKIRSEGSVFSQKFIY